MNSIGIQLTKGLLVSYNYCLDAVVNTDSNTNVKKGEKDFNKMKLSNNKFLSLFREFGTNFTRYVDVISNETIQYSLPYVQTIIETHSNTNHNNTINSNINQNLNHSTRTNNNNNPSNNITNHSSTKPHGPSIIITITQLFHHH